MNALKSIRTLVNATATALACLLALAQPVGAQQVGLGLIPPKSSDYDRYPAIRFNLRDAAPIPERFTLEEYLPPIGNQGQTGSCVGWSTGYYCYSISVARQRKLDAEQRKDSKFVFAPGWIWNQYNGGNSQQGMQIFQAFDVLEKMGCATLDVYPWEEKAIPFAPSEAAKKKAVFYKSPKTLVLFRGVAAGDPADPEKLRYWLAGTRTPIVIGIPVYQDFPTGSVGEDYLYSKSDASGEIRGYHAICIIGYDKSKQAFEMVNSWGESWGNHGKMWLSERFIQDYAIQGCVQTPGGPHMRGLQILPATPSASAKKPALR